MASFLLNDKLKSFIKECNEYITDSLPKESEFKIILEKSLDGDKIEFEHIKKLQSILDQKSKKQDGKRVYLHEILKDCLLYLPKYEAPPRNPELEARIQALKVQFAEQEYQQMVSNVNLNSKPKHLNTFKAQTLSTDFRSAQGQIIAIINVIVVIIGSFFFGYKSVEYSLESPNYVYQVAAGLFLAIIVAVADFYFLFKKLLRVEAADAEKTNEPNKKK